MPYNFNNPKTDKHVNSKSPTTHNHTLVSAKEHPSLSAVAVIRDQKNRILLTRRAAHMSPGSLQESRKRLTVVAMAMVLVNIIQVTVLPMTRSSYA